MKYLLGMSLLISAVAFASPISYKEKNGAIQQTESKKKKKKKGCGCGMQYNPEMKRAETS